MEGKILRFTPPMGITKQQPITTISKALRPRERLQKYGASYLEYSELLAIIIRTGTTGLNVLGVSERVMSVLESTNYSPSIDNLIIIDGISTVKAIEILATLELGSRIADKKNNTHSSIQSAGDCYPYLRDIINQKKEHFVVLYLDTKNVLIEKEVISIGTLDASLVHPREVFEPAYRHSCARIILAHNHPSGDITPSQEDLTITRQLTDAGKILGIAILDHLIVSPKGTTSLYDLHPELFD